MQLRIILPLILFLSINLISQNIQKTFTGAGGNNKWSNHDNWEPKGAPDSKNYNVLIPENMEVDLEVGVEVGDLHNQGRMLNVGILSVGELQNDGLISGIGNQSRLWLLCEKNIQNNGEINDGIDGHILIQGRNDFINNGNIVANNLEIGCSNFSNDFNGSFIVYRFQVMARIKFINKSVISSNNSSFHFVGEYSEYKFECINTEGTGEFYNSGTIESKNGEPGENGSDISIIADQFKNRGVIKSGEPGEGEHTRGGNITVSANLIDNAGVIFAPQSYLSLLSRFFKHNPSYNDSPLNLHSKNKSLESIQSEYFRIESDYLWIEGKELLFGNMGNFGSGTTIIGTEAIYISNTNEDDSFMDFSENNFPGTIVSDNLILFTSNNIIEPAGGLASLCSITPQIAQGGVDVFNGVIISEIINDSSGAANQGTALFKNQCSFENSFPYTVTSQLGWVTDVSAETGTLNPWEVFSIEFDYQIPAGITEITIETIIISVEMSQFWTLEKKSALICDPELVTSIDTRKPLVSNFKLYQNYPNPFNPITTIKFTVPGVEIRQAVSLRIYDILGREVAILVDKRIQPGNHEVQFDGSNLSSGMYFYQIITDSFIDTKKMVLIK
ncbi:MAG: T9SS type A sorting domain-containing protein [Melioribacteraceae bacterium]|nr:T9SS type A sorting domain-containing protein [Melioribacteraceae bacterium]